MADGTHIEWTDATWNPITGCSVVSAGCKHCYAMKLAGTRLKHVESRRGLTADTKAGPVWTGEVRFNEADLLKPLSWRRPRMIFVCAHGDLFHENVPDERIDRVFAVMALCPQHRFQVLTKRPARMREYLSVCRDSKIEHLRAAARNLGATLLDCLDMKALRWPLPNVWLGVSVEDQAAAVERIPILLDTPAALRWISAEPLLGPVDIRQWQHDYGCGCGWGGQPLSYCNECGWRGDSASYGEACPGCGATLGDYNACPECDGHDGDGDSFGPNSKPRIDWVVAGGESGPGARPMHPDWARSLRDQCAAVGVPFLFKQWGGWIPEGQEPLEKRWLDFDRRRWVTASDGQDRYTLTAAAVHPVGKKAAGRLLDGVLHDAFPEARP